MVFENESRERITGGTLRFIVNTEVHICSSVGFAVLFPALKHLVHVGEHL